MIFDEIDMRKDKAEFILKVSFLEIYREDIIDLLDHNEKSITIREDKGNILLMGLAEERVNNFEEMSACLDKGTI